MALTAHDATLAQVERQVIEERLHRLEGHLARTARSLGISRTTLWRRMRQYGITVVDGFVDVTGALK